MKQQNANRQVERTDSGTVMKLTPDELVRLAPRLLPYLAKPGPSWPEIVEVADWLRHDLGVSKPLWGEACVTMGREQAAIAVAVVSAKPADHFRGSPGAYFYGMVSRAKKGRIQPGPDSMGNANSNPQLKPTSHAGAIPTTPTSVGKLNFTPRLRQRNNALAQLDRSYIERVGRRKYPDQDQNPGPLYW